MPGENGSGPSHGKGQSRGKVVGRYAGGSAECICTKLGHRASHITGKPCNQMECPRCRTRMTRD